MLKTLIQFLLSLNPFKETSIKKVDLPKKIDDSEKIVRAIFSPINIKISNNKQSIKPNAYRSPSGKDEVSVLRQDYCSPTFCKQYAKKSHDPENRRTYFGFGLLTAAKIRRFDANVVYTPKIDNDYHADITIGYIPQKGEELPAEYQLIIYKMANASKFYIDPNPSSNKWEGEDLIY
jgi:hypothetical protein